jgi:hypothetical protein
MPSRSPSRLVTLVLLLAPLFAACSPWPDDDIGDTWVSGASTAKISWIAWSPDATTLYWINGGINSKPGTLYAMPAANRRPIAAATGVWGYPNPTLATDGREIIYATDDPATGGVSLNVATIGSDGTSLTAPRVLSTGFFSYLAAPDGTRVALRDYAGDTTVQDLAGGAAVDLGGGLEPLTFSPDGGALLARNAASNGAATHYAVADTSTGAITYLPFPDDETIWLVTAWTGESPSAVILVNQVIDLATGATTKLPGLGQVDALSGTPAPTFAYGWGEVECLGPYTNDVGDALCDGVYNGLFRDDLGTGAHDRIAAETVQALNDDDLFAVSPDGAWLAVAAGSGVIGEASSTAITVKHLSPPAGAAAP